MQAGLSLTWSQTTKTGFLATRHIWECNIFQVCIYYLGLEKLKTEVSLSTQLNHLKTFQIIRWNENSGQNKFFFTWVKVFRIIPKFGILRSTFHRKSASNYWVKEILKAYFNLKLALFCRLSASFEIKFLKFRIFGSMTFTRTPEFELHIHNFGYD